MARNRSTNGALYNVLFPLWLLVWWPSSLWLFLIPANYLIDRLVLWASLPKERDRHGMCRRLTWRLCLAGFAADFAGSLLLLAATLGLDGIDARWAYDAGYGITMNPWSHPVSLLVTLAALAVSACCIYVLDRRILRRAGIEAEQAHRSALSLALVTAPYLFLLPSTLIYPG